MVNDKNKNRISQRQVFFYISVLMLFFVTVPLFVIAHYNFMCVDDYAFVSASIDAWRENHSLIGVLRSQWGFAMMFYKSWQGTLSMTWLGGVVTTIICEHAYFLATYMTLGGLIISELILFMLIGVKGLKADKYDVGTVSCWLT